VQSLAPGSYSRSDFEPSVAFTIGAGWQAVQATSGFFDIEQEPGSLDVIAIQFGNVQDGDSAAEAAAAIEARDHLLVGPRETVEVDCRDAIRLLIDTTDAPDSAPPIFRPVLMVPPGALSIGSGRRLQVTLVDVDGGVLGILVGGSIAGWQRTLEVSGPVVDSVKLGG